MKPAMALFQKSLLPFTLILCTLCKVSFADPAAVTTSTHTNCTTTIGSISTSTPSSPSDPHSAMECTDVKITLNITSINTILSNKISFKDNFDVTDFVTDYTRKDAKDSFHPVENETKTETANYFVTTTFCTPKTPLAGGHEKTVLLATHGLGFDRQYWDSSYKPDEYNFVDYVGGKGYSIFFYDRLGVGESQKISGFVNQPAIQTEILITLTQCVRDGRCTGKLGKPKSIVLVGHSFGSMMSNVILAQYPDLVDGAVLTGMAYDSPPYTLQIFLEAIAPRIAKTVNPQKFGGRDNGYLAFADIYGLINGFFKMPNYEFEAAKYIYDEVAQPFAVAEFISLTTMGPFNAAKFKGPILVTTGEFDLPLCLTECRSSYKTQPLNALFNGSTQVSSYVHPGAGHAVNFSKNATGFYEVITSFLGKNGF